MEARQLDIIRDIGAQPWKCSVPNRHASSWQRNQGDFAGEHTHTHTHDAKDDASRSKQRLFGVCMRVWVARLHVMYVVGNCCSTVVLELMLLGYMADDYVRVCVRACMRAMKRISQH